MATKISSPIISTLMAELNVVKIGNKQMTISVFNQLYSDKCYDDDFNILYPIWGKVKREEEWVIFQKGNDLKKQRMPYIIDCQKFENVLINVIKENKEKILLTDIMQDYINKHENLNIRDSNWQQKMSNKKKFLEENKEINILREILYEKISYPTKEELDLVLTIIDKDLLNTIHEECRKIMSKSKKGNEMTKELHNSKQLFIAI